jgi:hypothetical protein
MTECKCGGNCGCGTTEFTSTTPDFPANFESSMWNQTVMIDDEYLDPNVFDSIPRDGQIG